MRLRVLIIPDKFKGTLTAGAAAKAMAAGWRAQRPGDALELLPMSDGGDGFGEVLSVPMGARRQRVRTCDAAHRPCWARWWWQPGKKTAILETAGIVGLAMLPPGHFHPFELDTFGLGKALKAALDKGARRVLVGLGGSATNDGGFGLARGLGWEFVDGQGGAIKRWTELPAATRLRRPPDKLRELEVIVAVDVQNPLLGPRGATRIYGPQKGLGQRDFTLAEECLRRLAWLVRKHKGRDLARHPGAGAAGGLGFGFAAFLDGALQPGFELFAAETKLEEHLRHADLVITGEGAMDRSTFMGKGTGQVAARCRALGIPCIGLAGTVSHSKAAHGSFRQMRSLAELASLEQAKAQPALWLERLAAQVAGSWPIRQRGKLLRRRSEARA